MASIFKRKLKDGKGFTWRAVVRITGFPTACESFELKQEAEEWAHKTEAKIKTGQFKFAGHKKKYTYTELLDRLKKDGFFERQRSLKHIGAQFEHWRNRFGGFALIHITSEMIVKERQYLIDTPAVRGTQRNPSTVNRYMAVLSSTLSYAVKQLRWIGENPCNNLLKLKESRGRDRVLTEEEVGRLLAACRASKSPYLYSIVLIALTTGARRGEILNLEWRHVDFENCLANIKETKNGRPRSVPLVEPIIEELKKIHAVRSVHKPLVFASLTAFGRIDTKKAWQEALKRAKIVDYHFHDLRHLYATFAAAQGASNVELCTAMGHRTLGMLLRYSNLDAMLTKKFSQHISEKIIQGGF